MGTVGRVGKNSLSHCCSCLIGVRSGLVMLEDELIHLPVWLNPSNSLFSFV